MLNSCFFFYYVYSFFFIFFFFFFFNDTATTEIYTLSLHDALPTSLDKQVRNLQRKITVAVATPGRMIDLLERGELDLDAVRTLVIDEADRMADMGFLPQVEWILRKVPNDRQTLLFSATLDREVDVLVRRYMRDPVRHEVESDSETIDDMTH